jgi:hypothetical protein
MMKPGVEPGFMVDTRAYPNFSCVGRRWLPRKIASLS